MSPMVLTTSPTTCAALAAPRPTRASPAGWPGCALSAFWRTVAVSCSIELAVCSSVLACSSVRSDRSGLPWAISALATCDRLGRALDLGDHLPRLGAHVAQRDQQAGAVVVFGGDLHRQVAVGHRARDLRAYSGSPPSCCQMARTTNQDTSARLAMTTSAAGHMVHSTWRTFASLLAMPALNWACAAALVCAGRRSARRACSASSARRLRVALFEFEHDACGRQRRRVVIVEFLVQARAVVALAVDRAEQLACARADLVGLLADSVDARLVAFGDGVAQAVGDRADFQRSVFDASSTG